MRVLGSQKELLQGLCGLLVHLRYWSWSLHLMQRCLNSQLEAARRIYLQGVGNQISNAKVSKCRRKEKMGSRQLKSSSLFQYNLPGIHCRPPLKGFFLSD